MEFVDGDGDLEKHLERDWLKIFEEKLTWKKHILRIAHQTALAMQYLHGLSFFDEKFKIWRE